MDNLHIVPNSENKKLIGLISGTKFSLDYERRMSFQKVRLFDHAIQKDIPNLLNVDLEKIVNEPQVVFVGFPLKIKDGNAGPMRAAALLY